MTNATNVKTEAAEELGFEAEVSRLLHMMVHSVYSDRDIFLRELISNASDACDKLRYEALTNASLATSDFSIDIVVNEEARTITLSDNGIGMNREELVANLGTIARSGTANFMDKLTGDSKKDVELIGQFGVGFYSVFMVADHVTVTTKRAGDDTAFIWASAGEGKYSIKEGAKDTVGTEIVLHMKEDADAYLARYKLEDIIKTYSDHIAVPITLAIKAKAADKADDQKTDIDEKADSATDEAGVGDDTPTTVNAGSALWARPKSDITDEQYTEFYRHVSRAFDEPAFKLHYKVEGMQEYTVLLYIPSERPADLFDPSRKNRVKLYVKRIFITDDSDEMLPGWLRFLRGVVDSQDLPLNISREMLQNNPVLSKMSSAISKKIVTELTKMSEKDSETFEKIWTAFGPVIKEGIYEAHGLRDKLLELARFRSTNGDGWTTLKDYVSRMKDKQSTVYYVTGSDEASVARSPQLEGFRAKGVEVLLFSDPVDDFWLQMVPDFEGKPLKSITRGATDLGDIAGDEKTDDKANNPTDSEITTLTTLMKDVLGDRVGDVRTTDRLTETAACLVADDNAMDMHLERILKAHNQLDAIAAKVLEINPSHPVIKRLSEKATEKGALDNLSDSVMLILDQARILEGEPLEDATAFARRLGAAMEKGLA